MILARTGALDLEAERRSTIRRELEVFFLEQADSPGVERLVELVIVLPSENGHLEVSFNVLGNILAVRARDPDRGFWHDVTVLL
jgi:hypothetical protein